MKQIKNRNENGRPPLPIMEKKSYRITVKLNPTEHYTLKGMALKAGIPRSEIVREALKNCTIKERLRPDHAKVIRELTAMGNNLNQLTKRAHQAGFAEVSFEVDRLSMEIDKLIKSIAYDSKN